jgi:hypothetical protein
MEKIIVKELPEVWKYIFTRNISNQYTKVKEMLKNKNFKNIDFKLRQPKKYKVYQFRINKKYRWFWIFRETKKYWRIFVVTDVSDHQDF